MAEKKTGNTGPLLIGVAVALVGAFLVNQQTAAKIRKVEGRYAKDKVYLAVLMQDIKAAETITPDDVELVELPGSRRAHTVIEFENPDLGKDAKRRNEDVKNTLWGIAKEDLEKGGLLLTTDFAMSSSKGLDDKLGADLRAVTIQVDANGMMGGLLKPDDRVDVYATFKAGPVISGRRNSRGEKTVLILEDVSVLAVGGQLEASASGRNTRGGTIVLGLEPDKAMLMAAVQKKADISLVMRSSKKGSKGAYSSTELGDMELYELIKELQKNQVETKQNGAL